MYDLLLYHFLHLKQSCSGKYYGTPCAPFAIGSVNVLVLGRQICFSCCVDVCPDTLSEFINRPRRQFINRMSNHACHLGVNSKILESKTTL